MFKRLRYSTYVIFHPFDGFWTLKREGIGTPLSAFLLLAALIVTQILSHQFAGFLVNPDKTPVNLLQEILQVLLPVFLWCVANWCITTLMNGEGSFRDIFIATCYALTPLTITGIPLLLLGNVASPEELQLVAVLQMIIVVWTGFLFFSALMTIHQFTFGRTLLTVILAVLGMAIILFLALLLFSLVQQIYRFFYLAYNEISLRYR